MNSIIFLFYRFIVSLIHFYKWIEFQLLRLISPWLKSKGKELCASVGVILHCPGDPQWTEEDIKRALLKCKDYDYLIHVKVNDDYVFTRAANWGSLGIGECYMEGLWECPKSDDALAEFWIRLFENNFHTWYFKYYPVNRFILWFEFEAFNLQTRQRALQVGKEHYDLGNDLFALMLDPWMQYTCGYWATADNLDQAQLDKMDLIARKLDLKPGMKVLDIGCGWGYLCKYLAEKYQVSCVGVSISEEGIAHGKRICEGLPVEFRFQDYRELEADGAFDRIVSVGMFEHVGSKNYREFMQIANRCLKDDGIFLLHTIGTNYPTMDVTDRWLLNYIFPNGRLPRAYEITKESYELFIIEDWHNFGADYAKTLNAWRNNFTRNWGKIEHKYGDKFYRMWIFYLTSCEASFRARKPQLWQIVMSKTGLKTGYRASR